MIEANETAHVVFGRSIADTLHQALLEMKITQRVIGLPGNFSVGPIDPPDVKHRRTWAQSIFWESIDSLEGIDGDAIDPCSAWIEATAPCILPVFWVCLSAPAEHACFLAFATLMRNRQFDFVDVTNLDFTTADGIHQPSSLGTMRAKDIVASEVYARRRPASQEEREAALQSWSKLRSENAPCRIVREGRLVSAPLTHYDALLIRAVGPDWEIAIGVIGRVVTTFYANPNGEGTSGEVLFGRLLSLGEIGAIEIEGSGPGMRDYHVRNLAK